MIDPDSIPRRLTLLGIMAVTCAVDGFGASPLIDAAKNADTAAIHSLIQNGADVNAREGDDTTALIWSAYADDDEAVAMLLRAGADANAANDLGATALWAASQNGNAAIVRALLQAGAGPDKGLLSGETPLMVAARGGFTEASQALLQSGANPNLRGSRGQTALMWAAAQKHPEVVEVLLAHGAAPHLRSESWGQMMAVPPHGYPGYNRIIPHGNYTPLLFAARSGDLASATLLVASGANVNDVDAWGVSSAVLAAHSGFRDLLVFLLDQGADPNLAGAGFSALHIAIMRRDRGMIEDLISHGADPNAPIRSWTPTRRSSQDRHFQPELVGATPFWLAARFTQPDVMRLLAQHGADPRVVHRSERVRTQRLEWPVRVEETTALIAALGNGGGTAWTPLPREQREALMLETVETAVELGVDINARDLDGRTALDIAKTRKYDAIVEYLTAPR